ncbi:hypothetical protein NEOLEDRAFT_1053619 [Neolentinus lepideus HHB14362 ss-1]|uniref:FAS1 domain-containing protein n=1 Tax=Neolentinus lepideus HHB14362 ss-1 TaxID=1314782 RepID=A0A165WCD0_9AGAM|nr:hypothetical protein NEOLEDRAFT_1053619 [Neolentinus lepideus HHB14362 ss-1]
MVEAPIVQSQPRLADLLTIESSVSIFYSYAREVELSELFNEESARITLLVPTNKAVMALARKPHQGPTPLEDGRVISEQEYDVLSKENVQRWVSAHIIPESPIVLESRSYDTLLAGKSIEFEKIEGHSERPDWARIVLDRDIRIISKKEAINGVLYLIDGTVKVD